VILGLLAESNDVVSIWIVRISQLNAERLNDSSEPNNVFSLIHFPFLSLDTQNICHRYIENLSRMALVPTALAYKAKTRVLCRGLS
jgi:hypothetical protein